MQITNVELLGRVITYVVHERLQYKKTRVALNPSIIFDISSAETLDWNPVSDDKPKVSTVGGRDLEGRAVGNGRSFFQADISLLREVFSDSDSTDPEDIPGIRH